MAATSHDNAAVLRLAAHEAILQKRWPRLADLLAAAPAPASVIPRTDTPAFSVAMDGVHLCSAYDRAAEADLQAALVPEHSPAAWVYGLGSGDLIRTLLTRAGLQRLTVVILHPGVARECLRHFDHRDWLADPRVELQRATPDTPLQTPFAALPACLRLADDQSARLRDLVTLELNTPYIRANFAARATEFRAQIAANTGLVAGDGDVAELFSARTGPPTVVAAAGPSLAEHYDWLRDAAGGCRVIAVDAALRPLLAAGIVPDLVVCIDGDRNGILPYFDADLTPLAGHRLVYFPIVHRDVLLRWPGRRLTAYPHHSLYAGLRGRYPRGELFASGTVTHAAVDLAMRMGSREIHLLGTDFCFPHGMSHVTGSAWAAPVTAPGPDTLWVLDGNARRVATLANLRAYLRDLESYIAAHPGVDFINHSRSGARILGARYLDGRP